MMVTRSTEMFSTRRLRRFGYAFVFAIMLLPHAADAQEPPTSPSPSPVPSLVPSLVPPFPTASSSPAPPPPRDRSGALTRGLLAGSFILHGIDLSESMYRFGQNPQRFHEANPILRPLQDNPVLFSAAKMSLSTGVNWFLLHHQQRHPRMVKWILIAQNSMMIYVAIHNSRRTIPQ